MGFRAEYPPPHSIGVTVYGCQFWRMDDRAASLDHYVCLHCDQRQYLPNVLSIVSRALQSPEGIGSNIHGSQVHHEIHHCDSMERAWMDIRKTNNSKSLGSIILCEMPPV